MIPKYSRPESPISEDLSNLEVVEESVNMEWKNFFKSQDIKKIIQTTLDNNRDLRVAMLNVDAARALYDVSKSDLLPTFEGQGSFIKRNSSADIYSAEIAINAFEVDLFGKIRSRNKAILEDFFSTEQARKSAEIVLIAEVADAYLQLLANKEILKIASQNLKTQEKSYNLVKQQFKSGIISKSDLADARKVIEDAKFNKSFYGQQIKQDKNALLFLMGISNSDVLDGKYRLKNVKLMEKLPTNLKSEILLFRPDIMQAEHNLKAANAQIGAARAAFFPTISLVGSAGFASEELSRLFYGGSSKAWNYSPSITVPIFSAGRNSNNLKYSKIIKKIEIANYEKSIQNAFREVSDEFVIRKNITDQLKSKHNLEAAARISYLNSKNRYQQGIDNYIDLADRTEDLFLAQIEKINLEKEKLSNLIRIYKVLGGSSTKSHIK
ncbi:MAG: multidrug efflux system outer membrane protein [Lentimonas sp.]|jgi:multidrug efflux system outer membrane protein